MSEKQISTTHTYPYNNWKSAILIFALTALVISIIIATFYTIEIYFNYKKIKNIPDSKSLVEHV